MYEEKIKNLDVNTSDTNKTDYKLIIIYICAGIFILFLLVLLYDYLTSRKKLPKSENFGRGSSGRLVDTENSPWEKLFKNKIEIDDGM